ncbi:TPA: hypothetical protein ACF373_005279, partial [Vibrio parahaemolyticus]
KGHPKVAFSKRLVELAGAAIKVCKIQQLQLVRLFVVSEKVHLVPYLSTILTEPQSMLIGFASK